MTSGFPDAPDRTRYTEQQLAEILRRAAERQEAVGPEAERRFSLAEIQQIASEVGIAPVHVANAAGELVRRSAPSSSNAVLGAPASFRVEEWLDGEIPTEAIGDLFDIARRELGTQGQVTEALDTVEWRGRTQLGGAAVTVTRRGGRTKLGVFLSRSDAAVVVGVLTGMGGLLGAIGLGAALAPAAAAPMAVAAAVAVSLGWGGAGSWLAARSIWRPLARRWDARTAELAARLGDAAQRAIAESRIPTEMTYTDRRSQA